ncbi:MAG: acyl dehydratase [Candidatus Poriferisodalaceae bacterium]|jgi:acyl dehydratase
MKFEDVELGDDLPTEHPDLSLPKIQQWCDAADQNFARFTDHEAAKAEGLPGALVPGIMSQGFLLALIHRWAPGCTVRKIDTVFRGPLLIETTPSISGAVTDTDEDERTAEVDLTVMSDEGRTVVIGTAIVAFAG